MRAIVMAAPTFVTFVMTVPGCTGGDDEPRLASSTAYTSNDAGLEGETDAEALTCAPDIGQSPCDDCVYDECCAVARACSVGTTCDALWTCARNAGCLGPQTSDFDACAVAACPLEATEPAVAAIEALASCIRGRCSGACGG